MSRISTSEVALGVVNELPEPLPVIEVKKSKKTEELEIQTEETS